jgi:signal transduction histidine kinase
VSDLLDGGRQGAADRAGQLLVAQVSRAFGGGQPTRLATLLLVGVISATMEGVLLWDTVPRMRIIPWVAMICACHAGGAILQLVSHRRLRPGAQQAARWARYKVIQRTLMGLAWGSSVPLLYVPEITETLLVPVIVIVALTSASISTHADYPASLNALLLSCLLPPAIFLLGFASAGQAETFTGYTLLILLGVLISAGRSVTRTVADALLARIDLAEALAQERRQRIETERARSEAEAAKEQTTRFFTSVSHDLRQPAHALGLYMSLLRRNPPERERQELIDNIASCADNLDSLFYALLGASEAIEAPAKLSMTAMPLRKLIAQAVVQFTPEAQRKGIDLRAAQTSLWVRTDEAALGRILGNLVANAIRYTESGKVLIGVRRRRNGCALVVADSGIGIAPEHQGRVFADFYQVNNPGRDRHQGFGLGLATVRRLCDSLRTQIELRSKLGRGSMFSVELECVEAEMELARTEEPGAPSANLHVLLVEDDALVSDAMQKMLADWDMSMRTCATGDEALAILNASPRHRWHVLLDYRLAGDENGLDIADRLRASCDPVPAISLITGEADPAVFERAATLGIVVLSKPVKPIRLRGLLAARAAVSYSAK